MALVFRDMDLTDFDTTTGALEGCEIAAVREVVAADVGGDREGTYFAEVSEQ